MSHHFEFGDYHGIIIQYYIYDGKVSKKMLPLFDKLKKYNTMKIFNFNQIVNYAHPRFRVYINAILRQESQTVRVPSLILYTKTNIYVLNQTEFTTLNNMIIFIKMSYQKEILNEKIKILLLISKKRNSSKYDYVNCFVKGICVNVIKYMCMIEIDFQEKNEI